MSDNTVEAISQVALEDNNEEYKVYLASAIIYYNL